MAFHNFDIYINGFSQVLVDDKLRSLDADCKYSFTSNHSTPTTGECTQSLNRREAAAAGNVRIHTVRSVSTKQSAPKPENKTSNRDTSH